MPEYHQGLQMVLGFKILEDRSVILINTHLANQIYVWHSCKWNFAGPQIYETKSQHFGVSLKRSVFN